jgi:hypothetical protein
LQVDQYETAMADRSAVSRVERDMLRQRLRLRPIRQGDDRHRRILAEGDPHDTDDGLSIAPDVSPVQSLCDRFFPLAGHGPSMVSTLSAKAP